MAKGKGFSSGRSTFSGKNISFSTYRPVSIPKKVETINKPFVTSAPSGFLSSMADGFSFGVGSSVARNMVDRLFSSSSSSSGITKEDVICKELNKSFIECMNMNNQDLNICKKAFEDYELCKKNYIGK